MSGVLMQELKARDVQWVALAGFLLKVPEEVCTAFAGQNGEHPSSVVAQTRRPRHVRDACASRGERGGRFGVRHDHPLVNKNYDEGDVLFQGEIDLATEDTADDIARKVLELEHRHYAQVLEGLIRLDMGRMSGTTRI